MLMLKEYFESLGIGHQGFSLIMLSLMFSFIALSVLIMLVLMLKKVMDWFKKHPVKIKFPDKQEPHRRDESGMLMRFFDALYIGPSARAWMGFLFVVLMIELFIRLGVWFIVNTPGRFAQGNVSIPLSVEPAQENTEQRNAKGQQNPFKEPPGTNGQLPLQ